MLRSFAMLGGMLIVVVFFLLILALLGVQFFSGTLRQDCVQNVVWPPPLGQTTLPVNTSSDSGKLLDYTEEPIDYSDVTQIDAYYFKWTHDECMRIILI